MKSIDEITETLIRLQQEYPVRVTSSGKKEVKFTVDGIEDTFHVSVHSNDCIICTESWHEHVADYYGLNSFLHLLFSGTIRITVKYRGRFPVAHCVRKMHKGKEVVISRTGSLVSPFWKKKSYKTLEYQPAKNALEGESR